jgi:hypothetical protein
VGDRGMVAALAGGVEVERDEVALATVFLPGFY